MVEADRWGGKAKVVGGEVRGVRGGRGSCHVGFCRPWCGSVTCLSIALDQIPIVSLLAFSISV
jgi:hypothetical protein